MNKEFKITWDDLPEDIKELVEFGLYTEEEALEEYRRSLKTYRIISKNNK